MTINSMLIVMEKFLYMHGMMFKFMRYKSLLTPAISVKNKTLLLDMMVLVVSITTTNESEV